MQLSVRQKLCVGGDPPLMPKYTATSPHWHRYQSRRTYNPEGDIFAARIKRFGDLVMGSGIIAQASAELGFENKETATALVELSARFNGAR